MDHSLSSPFDPHFSFCSHQLFYKIKTLIGFNIPTLSGSFPFLLFLFYKIMYIFVCTTSKGHLSVKTWYGVLLIFTCSLRKKTIFGTMLMIKLHATKLHRHTFKSWDSTELYDRTEGLRPPWKVYYHPYNYHHFIHNSSTNQTCTSNPVTVCAALHTNLNLLSSFMSHLNI